MWLKVLCSSLEEASSRPETEHDFTRNQKKEVIRKAIHSLVEVFEGQDHHQIALRFDKLGTKFEEKHDKWPSNPVGVIFIPHYVGD